LWASDLFLGVVGMTRFMMRGKIRSERTGAIIRGRVLLIAFGGQNNQGGHTKKQKRHKTRKKSGGGPTR